jgi:hypothetical protein
LQEPEASYPALQVIAILSLLQGLEFPRVQGRTRMNGSLLTLRLKRKSDLLRARMMVRQAAALLGFHAQDQICLAAAAFDLACQGHKATRRASMQLDVQDDCLLIVCSDSLRLSKTLPATAAVPRDDVPWMLKQLAELAPCDLFEEVRKVNQELLQTMLELTKCQPQPAEVVVKQAEPNAA